MKQNDPLFNRLREFTKSVVGDYSFEQLSDYIESDQFLQEYSEDPYTDCTAEVLYKEEDKKGEYVCLATSGQDLRDKGLIGSVYTPVTCQVFIYRNGEVEFGSLGNLAVSNEEVDF